VLVELHVRNLGVIEELAVDLGPGMTALTGETGAGKTLVVEALALLLGSRADPVVVRPGSTEALVEGRFATPGGDEVILARAVAAEGRSRAWVDGRMVPLRALAEAGAGLVELHGQHVSQALLDPAAQRAALDEFAGVDHGPRRAARAAVRAIEAELAALGGDERARARQADLLRFQVEEIAAAGLEDPGEDEVLAAEEERLAEAAAHREAAAAALAALDGAARGDHTGAAVDLLGSARAALAGRQPLAPLAERLAGVQAEATDIASELRVVLDTWEDDPVRLAAVRARRQQLRELCRKYGDDLAQVMAFGAEAARQLAALEAVEARAARLQAQLAEAREAQAAAEAEVGRIRRAAAPALAGAVEARLRDLAMPMARLEVRVGDADPGDDVVVALGANPGEPVLPLAKVASGGELARAMLALRLVLTGAPPTMVFDEVDAGIGGEAAVSVGRALAEVAEGHQVLVVTHLPQVAAFADAQLAVRKEVAGGRTVARVAQLSGEERVVELARMLSGRPDSATARRHAAELLSAGAGLRRSPR